MRFIILISIFSLHFPSNQMENLWVFFFFECVVEVLRMSLQGAFAGLIDHHMFV